MVFNTGPHRLWGIEIYKGKPIFYSLGNFFFQVSKTEFPAEALATFQYPPDTRDGSLLIDKIVNEFFAEKEYWQGVVPLITFEKVYEKDKGMTTRVTGIQLYPVDHGQHSPIDTRGLPQLAGADTARDIISNLANMSKPYGTVIEYRGGIGVINLK